MKIFMLRSAAAMAMFFLVGGCSGGDGSSGDDCDPIICQNNGTFNTTFCGCDCPAGFKGIDCSTRQTPARVKISKILITKFPDKKSDGSDWDSELFGNSRNPDVYMEFLIGTNVVATGQAFNNVVSGNNVSYNFTPEITISDPLNTVCGVKIYNENVSDPDDLMFATAFYSYQQNSPFTSIVHYATTNGKLEFDLTMTYEFL